MRTLYLDLASHEGLIASVEDDRVTGQMPVHARLSDSDLMPIVEKFPKPDRIACIIGPGGFTSIRMAVTLANVLGDQWEVPVAGVHLSDVYGVRCETQDTRHKIVWLHSTKKEQLFVRTWDEQWMEPTLVTIDECNSVVGAWRAMPLQWMGELIPEHQSLVGALQPASLRPIADVLPAFLAGLDYGKKLLEPWYGRGW